MFNTKSAYDVLLNASAEDKAKIETAIQKNFTENFYKGLIKSRVKAGRGFDDILEALVDSHKSRLEASDHGASCVGLRASTRTTVGNFNR